MLQRHTVGSYKSGAIIWDFVGFHCCVITKLFIFCGNNETGEERHLTELSKSRAASLLQRPASSVSSCNATKDTAFTFIRQAGKTLRPFQ